MKTLMRAMAILMCLAVRPLAAAYNVETVAGGGPWTTPTPVPSYGNVSFCPSTIGGVEFLPNGDMVFADGGGGRIYQENLSTQALTLLAGTTISGWPIPVDGQSAASLTMVYILDMRREPVSGDLFVAEGDSKILRRILWSSMTNKNLYKANDYIESIQPLANGDVYFTLLSSNQVFLYSAASGLTSTAIGSGTYGQLGEGGPVASAQLISPTALMLSPAGELHVADAGRILKVHGGNLVRVAGDGSGAYSADGAALATGFSRVQAMDINSAGDIFFTADHRVREVPAGSGQVLTIGGNGSTRYSGDGGDALAAKMDPAPVRQGPDGNIYFGNQYGDDAFGCGGVRRLVAVTPVVTPVVTTSPPANGGPVPAGTLHLYPQPDRGPLLHLRFDLPSAGTITVRLFNDAGLTVATKTFAGSAGQNILAMDIGAFASGIYTAKVELDGATLLGPKNFAVIH